MGSIFINVGGTILEFRLNQISGTLSQLVNESSCPLWRSEADAISAGSGYNSDYNIQNYERDSLIQQAGKDTELWGIIFFLDSVSART